MCELLAICAVLMYFQLGCVRTYTDFRVWRNNYGILATNVNRVTAPLGGAVLPGLRLVAPFYPVYPVTLLETTGLNALQAVAWL